MDETTAVNRLGGGNSVHCAPPSTYIHFDIIQETILCRLPVKSLQRFRCICKPWDSLVSKDLKFAKKHLRVSPKRQQLVTTTWREGEDQLTVMSCPFDSLNLHSTFDSKSTQLDYSPIIPYFWDGLVASCDGILCFANDEYNREQQEIHHDERLVVLYNPCIRKLEKLPCIDLPRVYGSTTHYAFGYDPFIDNYKVVAVFSYGRYDTQDEVHSYILGTDSWKRIKDFPSMFYLDGFDMSNKHGIFMRGTVNWLSSYKSKAAIVSLHLGKESYHEISLPDLLLPDLSDHHMLTLYVMRDCLCVFENISQERMRDSFTDVWLMKEYGNKESWIKLFRLSFFGNYAFRTDIVYISEDNNHVLLVFSNCGKFKWIVYDLKNDTITTKNSEIQDNFGMVKSKVYVESLISP